MSDLMTDEEQIIWFLREFENAEDEQLEDCELEIYGEDEQGREGTCTISVQEIAKKAADFIEKMVAERDEALAQNADYISQLSDAADRLDRNIVEKYDAFDKLKAFNQQNAELVAQVGRMQTFIRMSADKWKNTPELEPTFLNLLRVANQQPEEALREICAEAGRAGFLAGSQTFGFNLKRLDELADSYADRVKAGEV